MQNLGFGRGTQLYNDMNWLCGVCSQTIQRCLNCLSAVEQRLRRNAIEKLYVCLLEDDGAGSLPPIDILQVHCLFFEISSHSTKAFRNHGV